MALNELEQQIVDVLERNSYPAPVSGMTAWEAFGLVLKCLRGLEAERNEYRHRYGTLGD